MAGCNRLANLLALAAIFGLIITPPSMGYNIMYSPEVLNAGQALNWGSYSFIMQNDCNLVLYQKDGPIWASNTGGLASGCHLVMQSDGNLVVYRPNNRALWASGSQGDNGNYVLALQRDRNVVVYGPARWATNTHKGSNGVTVISQNSTTAAAVEISDAVLQNSTTVAAAAQEISDAAATTVAGSNAGRGIMMVI